MPGNLVKKTIKGKTYHYYQETWREKVNANDCGKVRGSGKSRVRSRSHYLGTAEQIYEKMRLSREPVETDHRSFGFEAALLQTAADIGLVDILRENIPGRRFGIERWKYFLITIINRPAGADSKEAMGRWAAKTALPDLLNFSPDTLNSKSFWYATDDVISEKELRKRREKDEKISEELLAGLDDTVFREMENSLAQHLARRFDIEPEAILYDTTNFFTYIEPPTPSMLAATGHNKDSRHHLRQVGLALCVDKQWGIPFFHRLYRGNSQDAHTFSELIDDLCVQLKDVFPKVNDLVLVLDKGNNSKDTFKRLVGRIHWVGSLVPSHFQDLLKIDVEQYGGLWNDTRFHTLNRAVMGVDCKLVLTYNPVLACKQEHTLRAGVEKLKKAVREQIASLKRPPKGVPKSVESMLKESRYGKFLTVVAVENGSLVFDEPREPWDEKKLRFGKNLLFTDRTDAREEWVIEQYRQKETIEKSFEMLKSPDLIRFRPIRHWTDTKIRALGFCCVMSLVLIRIMLRKCEEADLKMSAAVLKQELDDLKEVVMIYSPRKAERKITRRSTVQAGLWELFDLDTAERHLTIHKPLY
jgi:transposase